MSFTDMISICVSLIRRKFTYARYEVMKFIFIYILKFIPFDYMEVVDVCI